MNRVEKEVADSEVVEEAAPDPKARRTSKRSESSSTDSGNTASSGTGDSAPESTAPSAPSASQKAPEKAPPQPRYDSDSFRKWARNNPEKAAELAAKHFKVELGANADGWKKHFISLETKGRKQQEQFEEREQAIAARDEEFAKQSNELLGNVTPILDVIEAEQKNDFPAIDAFIETMFKMPFDEYCKRRLRGLAGSTTAERVQKVQLSKKDQEIADLKAKLEAKEAATKPKETPKPKVSDKWVSSEIPEEHGVRDLANWEAKVQEAYQDSYDGEDYGMTIEEAADQVLGAFLEKKGKRPEPAPVTNGKGKPATKPKPKPKVHTDDDEENETRVSRHSAEDNEEYIEDFQQRVARALEKASARR